MNAKIQPAVLGATGYAGFELTRLLLRHPHVHKPVLFSRDSSALASLSDTYPHLHGQADAELPLQPFEPKQLREKGIDLLFLCTPHELSREIVPQLVDSNVKVVDLSGAWRLKSSAYRKVYGFTDDCSAAARLDKIAVYGIPELHRDSITSASLIANAGCYATSIILALSPWIHDALIDLDHGIICDSKSGVSGAGKNPTAATHFVEVADNLSAYAVFGHRHTGEILEQLHLQQEQLQFTPHLLPIPRGILSTIYLRPKTGITSADLELSLRTFYQGEPFVRIFGSARLPQIKFSLGTNFCDIGYSVSPDGTRVVLISCLDNLLKGAAGQAVQNMNVMFGWNEVAGLQ